MQTILLLHGALGASSQFNALTDRLKAEFIVHAIDFSGHGGKAMPNKEFSIPLFAKEVREYVKQNNLQQVSFFGYSMGGFVAMYLARHFPGSVNKVITLGTKFYWDEEVANRDIKMLVPETIIQKVPAFAEELKQRHYPNDWKTILFKTKEMLQGLGEKNALQIEDYKSISNDCLLLIGDSDKMVSIDETMAVFDVLPNARFKILPATPHPLEQVDVKLLAGLIRKFMNDGK